MKTDLKSLALIDLCVLREGAKVGKCYYEPYIEFILKRVEERFDEIRQDYKINKSSVFS